MEVGLAAGAAQQRAQPRFELLAVEGLGQIVVGAEVQVLDDVLQFVLRADDQHRDVVVLAAQLLEQRLPLHSRQHQIEQDGVIALREQELRRLLAGKRLLDRVAGLNQQLGQPGRQFAIVFNEQ